MVALSRLAASAPRLRLDPRRTRERRAVLPSQQPVRQVGKSDGARRATPLGVQAGAYNLQRLNACLAVRWNPVDNRPLPKGDWCRVGQ